MKRCTFLIFILFSSCAIKGNFEGLYSYYNRVKSRNPALFVNAESDSSFCNREQLKAGKVYIVTGSRLRECLKNKKFGIVYIWGPKCSSKMCLPLELIEQKCNNMKIDLFVVAQYYDSESMSLKYNLKSPILGIDTNYYNSNLTSNYLPKFIQELTFKKGIEDKFLFFVDGTFLKSNNSIDDISILH